MFYDIFLELCQKKGVKPGPAAEACGINRSNVSLWKSRGYTPRGEALNAIAEYFGVSVDTLLGKEKEPAATEDDELNELLEEVRRNPDLRAMFSLTKNATPEQVRQYINVIKAIRGGE